MSLHLSSTAVTMRRPARSAVQSSSIDGKFYAAVALLIAVLVADALLIWAAAPSVADLATFYVSTT